MVLTTGNKSEMSVGYATLYGDMNGGFNPIKDLYKMEVYRLCRWRNAQRAEGRQGPGGVVIPENILTKAPTRGAAREPEGPGQPAALRGARRHPRLPRRGRDAARRDRRARASAPTSCKKVERLLYLAEYKRRQAAPGVKISARNFGRDRRYPITNRFREDLTPPPAAAKSALPRTVQPRVDSGDVG